jgi:hypothetical protein
VRCFAISTVIVAALAMALGGCSAPLGFGGPVPPLATIQLQVTGDVTPLVPPAAADHAPNLQIALVWGDQWLTEPFCVLPPENDQVAAVIAAGCRDPFGFVPILVAADVPVQLDPLARTPVSMQLFNVPPDGVMIGDITARVVYGSFIVYDDHNGNGTLDLARASHTPSGGRDGRDEMDSQPVQAVDFVYGASFVTMTAPDQRLGYREGDFVPSAYYPRSGCGDPPGGFSILAAGGFSAAAGLAAAEAGTLPAEDPAACAQPALLDFDAAGGTVTFPVQAPSVVAETACVERVTDSSTRYREPPADAPDLTNRVSACAHLPAFGAANSSGVMQYVVSGRSDDACQGLSHYTLRGCDNDPTCAAPDWDLTASPPSWWPCPPAP